MATYSRREFLKMGSALAAAASLGDPFAEIFASGLERLSQKKLNILFLQGQSCSGCSVSLINTENPGPLTLLTEMISLLFHSTISAAQGHLVREIVEKVQSAGNFILVIEGSIPTAVPEACVIYGQPFTEILPPLMNRADAIVALGACAAFGGIPGAEGNPTGAKSVMEFMQERGISISKLINLPLCPTHPQSIVATLAYVAARGVPELTEHRTPKMFYHRLTHDDCPRYHYYERHIFAKKFGEEGCLFKLGCLGTIAYTECPQHQWNGGANWCIRAGAPCIGCSSELFAKKKGFPFYRKGEKYQGVEYTEADRKGGAA